MNTGDDSFIDPLRDPRHPGRPRHPDFWRLTEIVTQADGQSQEGGRQVPDILADVVDEPSLTYVAIQRARRLQQAVFAGPIDSRLTAVLSSVWVDAFAAGVRFQREGGHRSD